MKSKDLFGLIVAIVLLGGVGIIGFNTLLPKKGAAAKKTTTVEVVTAIPASFDDDAQKKLLDINVARDYTVPFDFNNLGNPKPFGQ